LTWCGAGRGDRRASRVVPPVTTVPGDSAIASPRAHGNVRRARMLRHLGPRKAGEESPAAATHAPRRLVLGVDHRPLHAPSRGTFALWLSLVMVHGPLSTGWNPSRRNGSARASATPALRGGGERGGCAPLGEAALLVPHDPRCYLAVLAARFRPFHSGGSTARRPRKPVPVTRLGARAGETPSFPRERALRSYLLVTESSGERVSHVALSPRPQPRSAHS
jgi:hypothetical protein